MNEPAKTLLATVAASLGGACTSAPEGGGLTTTVTAYEEAARAVSDYYAALQASDPAVLGRLLDPVWHGRRLAAAAVPLKTRSKADFLAQRAEPHAMARHHLTSLQVYFDDFAVARVDAWETPSASLLTLFRTGQGWRIAGESTARAECGRRESEFNPQRSEREVIASLNTYYKAVDRDEPEPLDDVFHADWHMKNLEDDRVVVEGKEVFKKRLGGEKHQGYALDRQIADIQIIYDCLAYARIDKPSAPVVTVFVLFRTGDRWQIVDKAYSSGRGR